jgi:hypothetical protein
MRSTPGIFYEYMCILCRHPDQSVGPAAIRGTARHSSPGNRDKPVVRISRNTFPSDLPARAIRIGNRKKRTVSCVKGALLKYWLLPENSPGANTLTTQNNHAQKMNAGHAHHHAREVVHNTTRTNPHSMPAGGWLKDITTNENWRTTTIVQRHRDRAASTPSL